MAGKRGGFETVGCRDGWRYLEGGDGVNLVVLGRKTKLRGRLPVPTESLGRRGNVNWDGMGKQQMQSKGAP
jgi:hypothetical protein